METPNKKITKKQAKLIAKLFAGLLIKDSLGCDALGELNDTFTEKSELNMDEAVHNQAEDLMKGHDVGGFGTLDQIVEYVLNLHK